MTERYVDRKELARIMAVSTRTVDRWTREGMPSEKWGGRVRRFQPARALQWVRKVKGVN